MGHGLLAWLLSGCVAAGAAGDPVAGVAREIPVSFRLDNRAGMPPDLQAATEREIRRYFSQYGVELVSPRQLAGGQDGPANHARLLVFVVTEVVFRDETSDPDILGFSTAESGRAAFVSYSRVLARAKRFQVPAAKLLAVVIAHELGHLLLPGRGHATLGIMRAQLFRRDVRSDLLRDLQFTPEQVRLIRKHLGTGAVPAGAKCLAASGGIE